MVKIQLSEIRVTRHKISHQVGQISIFLLNLIPQRLIVDLETVLSLTGDLSSLRGQHGKLLRFLRDFYEKVSMILTVKKSKYT